MEKNKDRDLKQRTKAWFVSTGTSLVAFAKANYLMCAYVLATVLIELTGIAVTAGKFYMTEPWLFFTFVAILCLVSQYLPGHKTRYALFVTALLAHFVLDLVFIVIFDSTGGTVFDYAMFNLHNDAMRIVETLPFSFTYIFVSAVTLALYITLGFMFIRRMPVPNVSRSAKVATAAVSVAVLSCNVMISFFGNYRYDSNDLSYKLYQTETGTYSNKGIVGNFYNELVRGLCFFDINVGDPEELHDFIYKSTTLPTGKFSGVATGYNVVTVLCESFEWFTFLYDAERYPNGFAKNSELKTEEETAAIKAALRELYPNFYRFYESNSTVVFNNSYSLEKTDISENKSIIGNYPLYRYINYDYPTNTVPYSLPNIMKNLYGVESNSFHNGYKTFYNRNEHHTVALGFKNFTAAENIYDSNDGGGVGERNLDSVMMTKCREQMFPVDRRFNTYITTITQHGQYAERDNLKPYYDKLDKYGILPYVEDDEDANALRYYCAAGMDTDAAIGIMLDYLEENGIADNTIITLFGDHNAYYQGVSNYVKNIYSTDVPNYTELYRVPVMMKVGELDFGAPVIINKFTCVSDIYPTILDLLGITTFSNLTYGVSAFSEEESVLYSRAYDKFITDKIYFNSLSNVIYKAPDADIKKIEKSATALLDKISHVNRLFAADYFSGANEDEFFALLREVNDQPARLPVRV